MGLVSQHQPVPVAQSSKFSDRFPPQNWPPFLRSLLTLPPPEEPAPARRDWVGGITALVLGTLVNGYLFWRNHSTPFDFNEFNLINTALILWLPLFVVMVFLRREPSDFGLTTGEKTWLPVLVPVVLFLAFTPILAFIAPTPAAQDYYLYVMGNSRVVSGIFSLPNGDVTRGMLDLPRFFYHQTVMGFYMFGWEWFYRGFLLTGFRKIMPIWAAVLLQAAFFMAMHWSKPWPELLSSFPGAIFMALIALRFRSFVPCFLLHFLVSAGFDAAVLIAHFSKS